MASQPTPLVRSRRVVLRDGGTVQLRHVQPRDAEDLLFFLEGLSLGSVYRRFCSGGPNLSAVARGFAEVGPSRRGVVGVNGRGEVVAHAEYLLIGSGAAEVAVVVADALHDRGLATRLIDYLAENARQEGLDRFVAAVLPTNQAMLTLFSRGFGAIISDSDSMCRIEFDISAPMPERVAA